MLAEREELAMQCQELEARGLEVERRTRALNLNAVRDAESKSAAPSARSSRTRFFSQEQAAVMPKHASPQVASQRPLPLKQGLPSGIKVTSTVTAKTVKPHPASPQDGTGQDMKVMMQGIIRSSLTKYGVTPKTTPRQPQSQSIAADTESPQVVELSEGGLSDSKQEGPNLGTPELDQLRVCFGDPLTRTRS